MGPLETSSRDMHDMRIDDHADRYTNQICFALFLEKLHLVLPHPRCVQATPPLPSSTYTA